MFKKIIRLLLVVLIIWVIILIFNIIRCKNYKKPILYLYSIGDEYSCTYTCLGYNIDVHKENNIIVKTKMSFLNKKLFETKLLYKFNPNRKVENVHVSVIEDSISKSGVNILVIDNNEVPYTWNADYKIEQKINETWIETKPNKEVIIPEVDYNRNDNNEIFFEINWINDYGELPNGIYRIVKTVNDDNTNIKIYSNEFEIQ